MKSRKNTPESQMQDISSAAESAGMSFAKVGKEWVVLDRVVRFAAIVATFLKGDKRCNDSEVTLKLCLFQNQRGITRKISQNMLQQCNNAWRGRCEDYCVSFVNADRGYEEKQIVVKYKTSHSSLAALFGKQTAVIATYTDASTGTDLPPVSAPPAAGAENVPPTMSCR
jgi:hypothetical protein